MKDVCTVNELLRPMMGRPSVRKPYCVACGAAGLPLNQHHVVRRGAGKLVVGGCEVPKPTVTLCGSGNASGCHRKAHDGRLHFRWAESGHEGALGVDAANGGHWELYRSKEPCGYQEALEDESGWRRLL